MSRAREGTVIGDKYRLERPLARGGMGAIWVARHLQLDMLVAVKFMDAAFAATAEGRSRFEREAKAVAQIQSPNIVHIHDYGIHDDQPYMAMELLRGEDLGSRIRREKQLRLSFLAGVVTQVCKALRKAHEAGIIHRDLKPANIYLASDDDDHIVKVLDFGVAKVIGAGDASEATKTGVVVGSVHYMSPEQARGMKDIDARSDLWSLAVIIYRALTARLPFPGDQMGDVIVKICTEAPPPVSSLRPDLGADLDAFFARAFARSPNDRFQSAKELAQAFSAVAGAPVESPTSSGRTSILTAISGVSGDALTAPTPPAATPPVAPIFPPPPSVGTITTVSQSTEALAAATPPSERRRRVVVALGVAATALLTGGALMLRGGGAPPHQATAPSMPPATAEAAAPSASASGTATASAEPETTSVPVAKTSTPVAKTSTPVAKTPPPKGAPPPPKKINSELGF